jgi:hypothetical protein
MNLLASREQAAAMTAARLRSSTETPSPCSGSLSKKKVLSNPMHNKHAEEAERIVSSWVKEGSGEIEFKAADRRLLEASIALSRHSAVQKEREEFAEALQKATALEAKTRGLMLTKDEIASVISRLQSDREKGG